MLNSLVDCYIVFLYWSMLYSPLMAANWEQMIHPLPPHIYSQNTFYWYLSYHSPANLWSALGLKVRGELLCILLMTASSTFYKLSFHGRFFIHIFTPVFQQPFLPLVCFVIAPLWFPVSQILPNCLCPNCAPIAVSCSAHRIFFSQLLSHISKRFIVMFVEKIN